MGRKTKTLPTLADAGRICPQRASAAMATGGSVCYSEGSKYKELDPRLADEAPLAYAAQLAEDAASSQDMENTKQEHSEQEVGPTPVHNAKQSETIHALACHCRPYLKIHTFHSPKQSTHSLFPCRLTAPHSICIDSLGSGDIPVYRGLGGRPVRWPSILITFMLATGTVVNASPNTAPD